MPLHFCSTNTSLCTLELILFALLLLFTSLLFKQHLFTASNDLIGCSHSSISSPLVFEGVPQSGVADDCDVAMLCLRMSALCFCRRIISLFNFSCWRKHG